MTSASASSSGETYDDDVFEIEDFTIVTVREGLSAEIEQLLRKWKLTNGRSASSSTKHVREANEWLHEREEITYGFNRLTVLHYWILDKIFFSAANSSAGSVAETGVICMTETAANLLLNSVVFKSGPVLCRQFGVTEFISFMPSDWQHDKVSNEDQLRSLLSVIAESFCKAKCEIPVFVQYGEQKQQLFYGMCQNDSMRTIFESSHLHRGHPLKCHLSGCIELFKEDQNDKSKMISAEVTEELLIPAEKFVNVDVYHLPFGATAEVIEEFGISAVWSNVAKGILIEEQNFSNLDPLTATSWKAWVSFAPDTSYLMSSCLKALLHLFETSGTDRVFDRAASSENMAKEDVRHALSPLVSSPQGISITKLGNGAQVTTKSNSLNSWLNAIFEKSKVEDTSAVDESNSLAVKTEWSAEILTPGGAIESKKTLNVDTMQKSGAVDALLSVDMEGRLQTIRNILSRCKSSPVSSLTTRIAVALGQALVQHGNSSLEFCLLWVSVVRELQDLYEHESIIPGIDEASSPNFAFCMLHQKLQLLQYAIEAKKRRTEHSSENHSCYVSSAQEEETFYDASELVSISNEKLSSERHHTDGTLIVQEGEGRLGQVNDFYLRDHPDVPLYEPLTQVRVHMTEDMLERHMTYLTSLSAPAERVKAQLEPLLSDMEAFKAANPGCCFEDFVRWHSPRDYVAESSQQGHLSGRMSGEDNIWQKAWQQAEAKPVKRQKLLFDDNKQANLILNELENVTIMKAVEFIIPVLLKQAANQLIDESKIFIDLVGDELKILCQKVVKCTQNFDMDDLLDCIKKLGMIEARVIKCNVIYSQLINVNETSLCDDSVRRTIRDFVISLVQISEEPHSRTTNEIEFDTEDNIIVEGGCRSSVGLLLKQLFFSSPQQGLNTRRQYIISCLAKRPGAGSRSVPHRLYASISKEDYRLCLSLSEDTILS